MQERVAAGATGSACCRRRRQRMRYLDTKTVRVETIAEDDDTEMSGKERNAPGLCSTPGTS